jgi:hypothetical protein
VLPKEKNGRYRARTCDLTGVIRALWPTELIARVFRRLPSLRLIYAERLRKSIDAPAVPRRPTRAGSVYIRVYGEAGGQVLQQRTVCLGKAEVTKRRGRYPLDVRAGQRLGRPFREIAKQRVQAD